MPTLTKFIDLFAVKIQSTREIDVESKITIHNIIDETLKQIKKTNVKDKTLNNLNMRQNEKQRHFKFDNEKFTGTNGKFLRVAVNKVTKIVRRVKPVNWTLEAKLKFYEKFPDLIDTEKPKTKKEAKKETKKKETKKKETKISTFDLIASLVEQANIGSLEEPTQKKEKIKEKKSIPNITEKEKKEIKETITQKIQFKTTTQPQQKKKKKITKNKKKIEKSDLEEINVKEFTHYDLKETQYIDEHNNIWNDMHKQIGYYDRDTDTINLLS